MTAIYWRCFHCGEGFTKKQQKWAAEHFGADELETPVCLMRVPGEGSLLTALRRAQEELAQYRREDGNLMRALCAQASDHATALRNTEEKGYAKALRDIRDGKIEPYLARELMSVLETLMNTD